MNGVILDLGLGLGLDLDIDMLWKEKRGRETNVFFVNCENKL